MLRCVSRVRNLALALLASTGGCDALFGTDPKITLTPTPTSVSVAQGGSAEVTLAIGRSHFTRSVTVFAEGAPAGVLAFVNTPTIENGTNSVTLHITASGSAAPGSYSITVHATGEGVAEQTATVDVTVTTTGTFGFSVLEPSVTAAQGGGALATILIPRYNENAGTVTIMASGVPAGVTATIDASPTTGASASMTFTANPSTAVGTYPISLVASQPGFDDQGTTFSLQIIASPSTASVTIPFCAGDVPAWFAYRNEGAAWQRAIASGNAFTFDATDRLTVVFVYPGGVETDVQIASVTRAELAVSNDRDCAGPVSLSGTVSGVLTGKSAAVNMGVATASLPAGTSSGFTLDHVNDRPLDLVAVRGTNGASGFTPDALIIRRALDLPNASTIPALDFSGGEAFAPHTSTLTVAGIAGSEQAVLQNTFWSSTATYALMQSTDLSNGASTIYSVPAAQLIAGDLHELYIDAASQTQASISGHAVVSYVAAIDDSSATMGPQLSIPTISTFATAPYARLRGRIASQPEYGTSMRFGYFQSPGGSPDRFVVVNVSAAFLGGTPAQWESVIPDLSGVPGFSPGWMLVADEPTQYFAEGFSGRTDLLFGALPAPDDVVKLAYYVAIGFTSQLRAPALRSAVALRSDLVRGRRLTQYFRR